MYYVLVELHLKRVSQLYVHFDHFVRKYFKFFSRLSDVIIYLYIYLFIYLIIYLFIYIFNDVMRP